MYGIVEVPVPAGNPCKVSEFRAYATVAICILGVASLSAPAVTPNQISAFSLKTDASISAPQEDPRSVENIPSWSGVIEQVPEFQSATPPEETE